MSELTVTEFLSQEIDRCGKTQVQIAMEAGFPRANIITMFKKGIAKVPVRRVPALAEALGVDPAHFLRIVLNEYQPEMLATLESVLGPIASDAAIVEVAIAH
jgi:DNA polymerase III epsilon subunit-like protein